MRSVTFASAAACPSTAALASCLVALARLARRPWSPAAPPRPRGAAPRPAVTTHASSFCANSSIIASSLGATFLAVSRMTSGASSFARFLNSSWILPRANIAKMAGPAMARTPPAMRFTAISATPPNMSATTPDVVADGVDLHVEALRVAAQHGGHAARAVVRVLPHERDGLLRAAARAASRSPSSPPRPTACRRPRGRPAGTA